MQEIVKDKWLTFRMSEEEEHAELIRLKKRVKTCKCHYCGGMLELRKITYSSYDISKIEIYCSNCNRIEYGVEPEIYEVAKYFVDELNFDHYADWDNNIRKREMNIAKVNEIIDWGCRNLGLLTDDGFTAELQLRPELLGEAIIISDKDLKAE